ncbi:ABC transporter permease [Olivibacter sp. XZL3]|uniref:ABC transporter permease n=1 Tax=Olivibacter sp. XZL3 TaxID=1735116 RepID=UPI001064DD32|nr:ABC transporter permease [Olivibacter sp. XZL3]
MFRSYFKIAWRNALAYRTISLINLVGLALGITCYLLINLWIEDEREKDHFHQNVDQLYTVYSAVTADGKTEGTYTGPITVYRDSIAATRQLSFLIEDIQESIPEITGLSFYATGYELPWGHPETFQVGEKKVKLEGSRASADFFKLFSYPLLAGSAKTALTDNNGIAISRKMAEIFFGSPQQAMGKTLRYENKMDFIITAVFENVDQRSSLQFDFLLNWERQKNDLEWASNDFFTYIQLAEGADVHQVQDQLNTFLTKRLEKQIGVTYQFGLQRFSDQYLYNHFLNGHPKNGRIEYVRIFSGVSIFILLMACLNFMSLATAKSVKRAKEVGLRKVVGSKRISLIIQFLGESILFALLASCLAALLLLILLPAFNVLVQKVLNYPFSRLSFWFHLMEIGVITGTLAGLYPALYLANLKPVQILKGIIRSKQSAIRFKQFSTVFQFTLSSLLIMATIVISRQMNHIQQTDLGYNRENLLYIRIEGELANYNTYRLFKERAERMPEIERIDRSTEAPHEMGFEVTDPVKWQGKPAQAVVPFKPASVGFDFIKLMKLTVVEGRDFSKEVTTDSADAFLVNQEAVKQMGMKDPIGKWISAWNKKGHIIGVLKDFHTQSLRDPIKPIVLDVKEYEYFGFVIIRIKAGQTKQAIRKLEKLYTEINPNYPFTYQFVDQEYDQLYRSELTIANVSIAFSLLSIIISCLGLLGLVIFAVEQRVKEIGVRKVLGASVREIVQLLSFDFIKLIIIALSIAIPVGYLVMSDWLHHFAYRITLPWWVFVLTAFATILIAQVTISFQAIRVAMNNPIAAIREE